MYEYARFGVLLFTHRFPGRSDADVLEEALDLADRAERLGLDDLWTTEHHFISYGVNPSALTFAAHLLGRTSRMRVGTAVSILPTHAPVEVAEQAALLDHLSGGRFDLGLGRGGPVVDYEVLGRSLDHWRHGFPEALELVLDSFEGPVSAAGERYSFREVDPRPKPRSGRPPVYLAGSSERNVDLAARHNLGLLTFLLQGPEMISAFVERHAKASGRPATDFAHGTAILAHVTETEEEAGRLVEETVLPFLGRAMSEYVLLEERDGGGPPLEAMAQLVRTQEAIGPVELCAARIAERLRIPGVSRVLLHVQATGDPGATAANLERIATEVLPLVRAQLTS